MYIEAKILHIRHLILSGKEPEGQAELIKVLTEQPYHDQAWTLAAQLTSDAEQRKIFVKKVFNCSDSMELADWGFQNFSRLEMEQDREITLPPNEYLVLNNYRRMPLDELVDLALNPPATAPDPAFRLTTQSMRETAENTSELITSNSLSGTNQDQVSSTSHSRRIPESMIESTMPFLSLKTIGKWIIVAAGIFFIVIVYNPYLLFWFMQFGIYPFYFCVLPMFFVGLIITIAGYLIEKK